MLRKNFLVLCFLYSIAALDFICPEKHCKSIEYNGSSINCRNLNLECALLHEGNIPLLKAIRSLNCELDTISSTLLKAEEKVILSVLDEDVAVKLLEREFCNFSPHFAFFGPYTKLATNGMFFRKMYCSIDLVNKILEKNFPNVIRGILENRVKDEGDFKKKILDVYQPKLFKGIWSTKKPYLLSDQIEYLIDQIYYAFNNNAEKTFTYISQMMKGSYDEPLRNSLNKDGVYKEYENSSGESYVHICQAVRQNFFPQILNEIKEVSKYEKSYENRKRAEKLNIKLELIYFCDDLINPENSTEMKIFWLVLVPGFSVFLIIFFHYWHKEYTFYENLKKKNL